ncbi:hypothetical protein LINPERHAP2_LOCUS21925, partial [Linum perenne]
SLQHALVSCPAVVAKTSSIPDRRAILQETVEEPHRRPLNHCGWLPSARSGSPSRHSIHVTSAADYPNSFQRSTSRLVYRPDLGKREDELKQYATSFSYCGGGCCRRREGERDVPEEDGDGDAEGDHYLLDELRGIEEEEQ